MKNISGLIYTFCLIVFLAFYAGLVIEEINTGREFAEFRNRLPFGFLIKHRIAESFSMPHSVKSTQQLHASSFNHSDVPSRYHYTTNGVVYRFRISKQGVVQYQRGIEDFSWKDVVPKVGDRFKGRLDGAVAISYNVSRGQGKKPKIESDFDLFPAPRFDMIAADGNRIFAKESDTDRFFFTSIVDEFKDFAREVARPGVDIPVIYLKLDPEYNQQEVNGKLGWWEPAEFGNHDSIKSTYEHTRLAHDIDLLEDIMMVRVEPALWHQIDSRPPFAGRDPPNWLKIYPSMKYEYRTVLGGKWKSAWRNSIVYHKVLSIGVGHMYRHQQYDDSYGGELFGKFPIMLKPSITDRGGFWNGSTCFYILVQLKSDREIERDPDIRDAYALLWIDEQSYISGRWRHITPEDSNWGEIVTETPLRNYWSPFRDGYITKDSRMAVSGETVIVTGQDPLTRQFELYSFKRSWETTDVSWRYRHYPEGVKVINSQDNVQVNQMEPNTIYPRTVGLRPDMTIYIRGTKKIGDEIREGRWFQRYLPADNWERPAKAERKGKKKPYKRYSHPWQFIPEEHFQIADRFKYFGTYEKIDHARSQYYEIELLSKDTGDVENIRWYDHEHKLVLADRRSSSSIYFNQYVSFRIANRGSKGWVATFWDMRDDELAPFYNVPTVLTLTDWDNPERKIKVRLKGHKRNWSAPVVQQVSFMIDRQRQEISLAFFSKIFKLPKFLRSVSRQHSPYGDCEELFYATCFPRTDTTIWRVRIVSLVAGVPKLLLDKSIDEFQKLSRYSFVYRWKISNKREFLNVLKSLNAEGLVNNATFILFEDVAGKVSFAEESRSSYKAPL